MIRDGDLNKMGAADEFSAKNLIGRPAVELSRAFIDIFPLPLALWDTSRRNCRFNPTASDLLKFSQEELRTQPNLWIQRIYENDLLAWHTELRRFNSANKSLTCDYRFFPKNAADPIWLREIMMPITVPQPLWSSMSAYLDITDLKTPPDRQKSDRVTPPHHDETLHALFHDINNRVQRLSMEIELAGLESQLPAEAMQKFTDSLASVTQALVLIHERVLGAKSQG